MFSSKFEDIINRQPKKAEALSLLGSYLESAAAQRRLGRLRLDPILIRKIGHIGSVLDLLDVIDILLAEKILKRVFVVESPAGGGLAEYSALEDVPETLHDHYRDTLMHVTPDDLRTVYVASEVDSI